MMKAIIHAINDDNVPGLQHLLGSLNNYDVNQPNKVTHRHAQLVPAEPIRSSDAEAPLSASLFKAEYIKVKQAPPRVCGAVDVLPPSFSEKSLSFRR